MNNFGIINFSNNCYLNVIIQLFLCNKKTSNIIAHYLNFESNNGNNGNNGNNKIINPKKLLITLSKKMYVSRQNDSQEAFTQLLDLIPDLEKYYQTKIKNSFQCFECNRIRKTTDTFSTFYIHCDSLKESIEQLITNETFELECEHCKKNTKTLKSCKIKELGEVLIFYNILKKNIDIKENIIFGQNKYKLTGIIKHYGNEHYGHYIFINYIKKIMIDDMNITELNNSNITFENVYLLIYTL
jgi:uncharacterized UBP type Zn finger protein